MSRPTVLWLTAEPPHPSLGGGAIRQAHLLRGLVERADVDLAVVGRLQDDALRPRLRGVVELAPPPLPPSLVRPVRRLVGTWLLLTSRRSEEIRRAAATRRLLAPIVATADHDHVVVEHAALGPLAPLPNARRGRWSLTLHNVASAWYEQLAEIAPSSREAFWWRRERVNARRFERWAMARYDTVVVPSEVDARSLPAGAVVIPNGVDTERFRPSPLPDAPGLVFTGTLGYLPNVDGVRWFCADVLPLVRRSVPEATFTIVGRDAVDEVRRLAAIDGVEVHEDVVAVEPYVRDARVAVVPVRVGTGTRLKALEAMAAGRPVVGTTIGLAGLDLEPGVHASFADDADTMAAAIVRLLGDDRSATALATAGRAHVEQRFSWEVVRARYVELLLDDPRARRRRDPGPRPSA